MVVFIHCQPDTVVTDRSLVSITDNNDVANTKLKVQWAKTQYGKTAWLTGLIFRE